MGTSKGYIAPTTLHWSKAKRAVTSFINNRDYDSKAKAARACLKIKNCIKHVFLQPFS